MKRPNILQIDGYGAVIRFDPEIDMFRGEFIGLDGGADFYAGSVASLKKEGRKSLKVFLDMCAEDRIEPRKPLSGKFSLRVSPEMHNNIAAAASSEGISINQWVSNQLAKSL